MARLMLLVTTIARACPPYLAQAGHLLVEVVNHDLRLEADGVVVVLHVASQLLAGTLDVELRVSPHRLDETVVAVDRRVVLQHVDDEAFLDRLLHGVDVEWEMPDVPALWRRVAEDFQGLVLGGGCKGEVAGVGQQLLALHQPVDLVLGGLFHLFYAGLPQGHGHERRPPPVRPWLEWASSMMMANLRPPVLVADGVQDERELLDGGDDDPLALLKQGAEVA